LNKKQVGGSDTLHGGTALKKTRKFVCQKEIQGSRFVGPPQQKQGGFVKRGGGVTWWSQICEKGPQQRSKVCCLPPAKHDRKGAEKSLEDSRSKKGLVSEKKYSEPAPRSFRKGVKVEFVGFSSKREVQVKTCHKNKRRRDKVEPHVPLEKWCQNSLLGRGKSFLNEGKNPCRVGTR